MLPGRVILVRDVHPEKAYFPRPVRFAGREMDPKELHPSNARSAIELMLAEENVTEVSDAQLLNALFWMTLKPLGKDTLSRLTDPAKA